MRALLYLTKRSMINNLKKAVKKPLTLLVVLACAAYAVFLAVMLAELAVQMKFDSAKGTGIQHHRSTGMAEAGDPDRILYQSRTDDHGIFRTVFQYC